MKNIIGREKESNRLNRVFDENEAQLVIMYGRRRVGKTYLIKPRPKSSAHLKKCDRRAFPCHPVFSIPVYAIPEFVLKLCTGLEYPAEIGDFFFT